MIELCDVDCDNMQSCYFANAHETSKLRNQRSASHFVAEPHIGKRIEKRIMVRKKTAGITETHLEAKNLVQ